MPHPVRMNKQGKQGKKVKFQYNKTKWATMSHDERLQMLLQSRGITMEKYQEWAYYWRMRSRIHKLTFAEQVELATVGYLKSKSNIEEDEMDDFYEANERRIQTLAELSIDEVFAMIEDFEDAFDSGKWEGQACTALVCRVYGSQATSDYYVPHSLLSEEQRIQQVIRWSSVVGIPTGPYYFDSYRRRPRMNSEDYIRDVTAEKTSSSKLFVVFDEDETYELEENVNELTNHLQTLKC